MYAQFMQLHYIYQLDYVLTKKGNILIFHHLLRYWHSLVMIVS